MASVLLPQRRCCIAKADLTWLHTVVEWLFVFTRPDAVQFLLDSWTHLRQHDFGFEDYGALERHGMRFGRSSVPT